MDAQHSNPALGLAEAADLAGCSRDTIRRAAQKGELKAEMGPGVRGPQWWIHEPDLLEWLDTREALAEHSSAAAQHGGERSTAPRQAQHGRDLRSSAPAEADWIATEPTARSSSAPAPPAEVYIALIDRLSRAERRSVELELQLRQSQRLLSENAESITEKEALAREARAQLEAVDEAKQAEIVRLAEELAASQAREAQAREDEAQLKAAEETRKAETERLTTELEATRRQLLEATQKPSGWFSWLGLRKKRTAEPLASQKTG